MVRRGSTVIKIFISSHGKLASGIKSSLNILIGNTDRITTFDAYINEKSVSEALDEFYQTVEKGDQVILISDLYGGSVNSTMFLYLDKPNTMLVSGVNLALVLELAIREKDISKDELNHLISKSREMLTLVENDTNIVEENDFF